MERLVRAVVIAGCLGAVPAAAVECVQPADPGVYAGAEVMFFKPFAEAGSIPNEILVRTGADDFMPAWRIWGGTVDDGGFGTRVRWWQYDQLSADAAGYASRLGFQKLDWEATQQAAFGRWRLLGSGGLTYVANQLGETRPADLGPSPYFPLRYRFDGVGVTLGLQAVRQGVWHPHWAVFGAVQWSAVYGNAVATQWGSGFANTTVSKAIPGATGSILELAVGPRWERTLGNGVVAFAAGNAEAQLWTTGLGTTSYSMLPFYVRGGDVGLVGLTFQAGFRR